MFRQALSARAFSGVDCSMPLMAGLENRNREPNPNGGNADTFVWEVLESTSDGVFMLDAQWRFVYLNANARSLISEGRQLIGLNVWDEFPAAIDSNFWVHYRRTMYERCPTEFVAYYPESINAWFEVRAYPTRQGISVFFRDITQRRIEEERLRLLEQAVAASPVGISIAKFNEVNDCPLIYVNPAFEELTGYQSEEVVGVDCRFLMGSDDQQSGRTELHTGLVARHPVKALVRNYKKDGQQFLNEVHLSQVHDQQGKVSHIVGIQNDVTDQLETEARLARQAEYDALTGLANRYLLLDRLQKALASAQAEQAQVAVVILDIDNFKHLNDTCGHMEADRLLVQVANRLNATTEMDDTVARFGGDEFALILKNWSDLGRLHKQVDRILHEIRRPILCGSQEMMVTGSAGVAIYPQDAAEAEALLQMADLAMYWVKRRGKNSLRFYSLELRRKDNESVDLAAGLRRALVNGEFRLHYQPRVDARTQQIRGFEALIRWQHPERGLLLPAQFIRIAEDTGLISEIGRWALEEALAQSAAWVAEGLELILMSVNVSPAQIRDPGFPAFVADRLAAARLSAECLELELTESLLIENADLAESFLRALRELGVRIAIDDFGSGYAGLQFLARFPADTLKIDHSFIEKIATDKAAAIICRSVLKLGQSLGLQTVAEGVEARAQVTLLRRRGCDQLQGFLFAKPLPVEEAKLALTKRLTP